MTLKTITNRIYSDFFLKSRLEEYEQLIQYAIENNYKVISINQFYNIIKSGQLKSNKYLVLRHDIDTDINTANIMFNIEKKLGAFSTFYFRLSTIDVDLMKEIDKYGSEASYHYEEIATYAKKNHIKDEKEIFNNIVVIREQFKENLYNLRNETGLAMETVASHGDFVNRFLKVYNYEILKDQKFRRICNISLEAYDDLMMKQVESRHCDRPYPLFWDGESPQKAIEEEKQIIYILTHPRHWKSNVKENLKDNLLRIKEGILYTI